MTTDNRGVPASFIQAEASDPAESWPGAPPNFGQDVLPHVVTIGSTTGGSAKAYSWADEALRDSRENADKMLTDCGVTECLEARLRSVALLNWHIAPENENSSDEKSLADQVTSYIKRTPHFAKFRWAMGLARWYGRYAVAPRYGKDWVGGRMRTVCSSWEPRHGDKLVFRYDDGSQRTKAGQVGIRVGAQRQWIDTTTQDYRGNRINQIEATQHGLVYWLNDKERRLIVVNKHIIEDGPFEDPLRAGAIHGIGIRDRIYWTWYGMVECLADILCYLERSAFGIEIWKYPSGNKQAQQRAEEAAKKITSGGRTVLIVPVFQGENSEQFGVQHIEPGLGGVEQAMTIVRDYFGKKIKRYILGQTLSSEAEATGMGSGVADAHLATLADIVRWDALNDEETLTSDFVRWLQLWNHPDSRGINLRMVIDTDSPDAEKKMKGYESAWSMGARIKEEDVLATIGASVPKATDRTLLNPAITNGGQQQGGFGGLGFQQPQGQQQEPPLPQSQQNAIREMAEKYLAGKSFSEIVGDIRRYAHPIDDAAKITATPSEAQAKAGNYRKGKTNLHGLTISIENAKGTRRKTEWPELSAHYGYINRTTGRDGDHVDVFVGPDPHSELVFVIDQQTASGRFDEHKVILGTTSEAQAMDLYRANYPEDWIVGPVTAMTIEQFKSWLREGDTTKPVGAQVSKYEARWITIGGKPKDDKEHKGGFPVQIDGEGRILKGGPKGLQGKHVSEIGKHFRETREARSKEADDFFGNIAKENKAAAESRAATDAPGNTRSLKKIIAYQAEQWGMEPETYQQFMDEVWSQELDTQRERENVKHSLRKMLGKDAGTLRRIEERGGKDKRGGDYSDVKGLDQAAEYLQANFPHLMKSNNAEQDAWDMIIEGKQDPPSNISREFHDKVDERLQEAMEAAGHNYGAGNYESEYIRDDFTEHGQPERYTFDESKVNRDESGQFAEKDGGESFKLTGKPKQERTLDIKLLGKAKQRDLFGGRGDAPGQTSFFDDIDPKAKNVRDQGKNPEAEAEKPKQNPREQQLNRTLSPKARAARDKVKSATGLEPWQVSEGDHYNAVDPNGSRVEVGHRDDEQRKELILGALVHFPEQVPDEVLREVANTEPAAMNELLHRNSSGQHVSMAQKKAADTPANMPTTAPPAAEHDEHLERAREVLRKIPKVSAKGLMIQLHGEITEEHAAELLVKLRGTTAAAATPPSTPQVGQQSPSDERPAGAADDSPKPQATPPSLFPDADDIDDPSGQAFPDETPREAAARASKKQVDENYAFARKSEVPNAGEDLLGSARHKRNEWKGLAEAEATGRAGDLVTRDNLLKNEPHSLLENVTPKNVLSSLAGHFAINAFPAAPFDDQTMKAYAGAYSDEGRVPGTEHIAPKGRAKSPEELRKQYYDAYSAVKSEVEKSVAAGDAPDKVMQRVHDLTKNLIHKYRDAKGSPNDYISGVTAADRYNPVANALVDLHKRSKPYTWDRHYTATSVGGRLKEFANRLAKHYGDTPNEQMLEKAAEHAQDIMEGHSFNKTFGTVGTRKNDFNPAELYVKHATRKGGRVIDANTVKASTDFLIKNLGMRGVQHGNSVTDEERQHHLQKTSEAFADLMDAIGLDDHDASLGGKLGMAFGARGRAGALAHYEPSNQVINLTRASGVGSLAHEWGHFFDHALMDYNTNKSGADFMSEQPSGRSSGPLPEAYGKLRESWQKSGYRQRLRDHINDLVNSSQMTDARAKYWQTPREIFARTFERYVQHKLGEQDRENTYLAGMRKQSHPLWPTDAEVKEMAPAFDAIFAAYKAGKPEKYTQAFDYQPAKFAATVKGRLFSAMKRARG